MRSVYIFLRAAFALQLYEVASCFHMADVDAPRLYLAGSILPFMFMLAYYVVTLLI